MVVEASRILPDSIVTTYPVGLSEIYLKWFLNPSNPNGPGDVKNALDMFVECNMVKLFQLNIH